MLSIITYLLFNKPVSTWCHGIAFHNFLVVPGLHSQSLSPYWVAFFSFIQPAWCKKKHPDLAQNCVAQCAWIVSFRIAVKPASGGLCLSEALGITSGLPSCVINLLNSDVIIIIDHKQPIDCATSLHLWQTLPHQYALKLLDLVSLHNNAWWWLVSVMMWFHSSWSLSSSSSSFLTLNDDQS